VDEAARHRKDHDEAVKLLDASVAQPTVASVFSRLAGPFARALGLESRGESDGQVLLVLTNGEGKNELCALALPLLGEDFGAAPSASLDEEALRVAILRILNLRRTCLKNASRYKQAVEMLDEWAKSNVTSVLEWVLGLLDGASSDACSRILRLQHPDTQAATALSHLLTVQSLQEHTLPSKLATQQVRASREKDARDKGKKS
jgi:hypothetical protein